MKRIEQLAQLAQLQATHQQTQASFTAARDLVADLVQAQCFDAKGYAAAQALVDSHRDAADTAEAAYLHAFDRLYPRAYQVSYPIVGESFFEVPA